MSSFMDRQTDGRTGEGLTCFHKRAHLLLYVHVNRIIIHIRYTCLSLIVPAQCLSHNDFSEAEPHEVKVVMAFTAGMESQVFIATNLT